MDPKYFLELLQQFPHRGVGTEYEKQAADLIYNEYRKIGLNPKIHRFTINKNGWAIYAFHFGLYILSTLLIFFGYNLIGAALFIIASILYFNIGIHTELIYKKFFTVKSQNVYVEFLPVGKKYTNTIVVLGHYDTAKRTIALKAINKMFSKGIVLIDKIMPNYLRGPFILTNIAILFIPFLLITSFSPIIHSALAFITLFIFIGAEILVTIMALSPPVPGAFDNGSGASVVMSLASHFKDNPLKQTRLILLNDGSEENYTNGFSEFKKEANIDPNRSFFINLDGVGSDVLLVAYGETNRRGMSIYFDRGLYAKAIEIAKTKQKYSGIREYYIPTPTDAMKLMDEGLKVAVTMCSIGKDGHLGHYHQMSDTIDKINFDTLILCRDYLSDLIRHYDQSTLIG